MVVCSVLDATRPDFGHAPLARVLAALITFLLTVARTLPPVAARLRQADALGAVARVLARFADQSPAVSSERVSHFTFRGGEARKG